MRGKENMRPCGSLTRPRACTRTRRRKTAGAGKPRRIDLRVVFTRRRVIFISARAGVGMRARQGKPAGVYA